MYLGSQAAAEAVVDLLFGEFSPSGRIAETFPRCASDAAAYTFAEDHPRQAAEMARGCAPRYDRSATISAAISAILFSDQAVYRDSLCVGYRYYTTADVPVLFPFGHGLTYTTFEYSAISIGDRGEKPAEIDEGALRSRGIAVGVDVANVGRVSGAEVCRDRAEIAPRFDCTAARPPSSYGRWSNCTFATWRRV